MTLYLLLNLALIIVAAGVIPVLASADDEGADATAKQSEALRLLLKLQDEKLDKLREHIELVRQVNDLSEEEKTLSQERLASLQNEREVLQSVLAENAKKNVLKDDELKILKEHIAQLKSQEKALQAAEQAADRIGDAFDKLAGTQDTWNQSVIGGLADSIDKGADFGDVLSSIGQRMMKNLSPTRLFGNLLTKIQDATVDLALAQDKSIASVNKSTQAYGQYDQQIVDVNMANRTFGVNLERVSTAIAGLNSTLTTFDTLNKSVQSELIATSGYLQVLGADMGAVAETVKLATTNLGMSASGAEMFTREVAALAGELKMDLNKALGDFNSAAPYLAQYGDDATETFKELAVAADNLSMDMSQLITIVDKFSTFEGAANAAGRLNAALGGDFLNSVSLMSASFEDPVDALRQLREGILAGAGSFDDMTPAQRRFIAESAGLSGVGELAQLLAGDLEAQQKATDANALSQEELRERTKAARDISELWKDTLSALAITVRPLVELLRDFVVLLNDGITKLDNMTESVGGAGTALSTLAIGFISFKRVILPLIKTLPMFSTQFGTIAKTAPVAGKGVASFTKMVARAAPAAGKAALVFGSLGLGLGAVGAGFGLIAVSLGSIVADFRSLASVDMSDAIANLGSYSGELAAFGIQAMLVNDDVEELATSMKGLAAATALLPTTPIVAVTKLLEKVTQLDDARTTPAKADASSGQSPVQLVFPDNLKLVVGTKNGRDLTLDAYLRTVVKNEAPKVVKKHLQGER